MDSILWLKSHRPPLIYTFIYITLFDYIFIRASLCDVTATNTRRDLLPLKIQVKTCRLSPSLPKIKKNML